MRRIERAGNGYIKPGQDLVVAGYPGLKGTMLLAAEKQEELGQWFTAAYLEAVRQLPVPVLEPDPEWLKKVGATECEAIEEGGIFTALWNLSGGYEQGISFTLRNIPLRQETVEICERFQLNPYRLLSGDCLLLAADNGGKMVYDLSRQGISAAVIGYVNNSIKREILHAEGLGYLERPQQDELWKVLPKPEEGNSAANKF